MLEDFEDATIGGLFCTSENKQIDERLVRRVLDLAVEIKQLLLKDGHAFKGRGNAGQVFRHQLETRMRADKELLKHKSLVCALFDWFLRYETIENACDSMDEVSITSYTDWTDWGDGSLLNFKQGYASLLDWFCGQIPARGWIKLDKQVLNIECLRQNLQTGGWLETQGARSYSRPILVRYAPSASQSKGSESNTSNSGTKVGLQTIECNHVIVTTSLGFLKQNYKSLFTPELPETKGQLIRSIGFGTVNKIFLQFERPFWGESDGFKLVWSERDRSEFPAWAYDLIAFDVVRRQPNLLIGWIGGLGARLMEQELDVEIGETCVRILERFLPENCKNKLTRLVGCSCSRWSSNPFVCGSYSFQSMESFEQNVDKLSEPIYDPSENGASKQPMSKSSVKTRTPRILFAGEATAGKLYSTTHGAIISGWREADRLADHLASANDANNKPMVSRVDLKT